MVRDNLSDVLSFLAGVQCTKVIDQRSHAWRKVLHSVHKVPKRNSPCKYMQENTVNQLINPSRHSCTAIIT